MFFSKILILSPSHSDNEWKAEYCAIGGDDIKMVWGSQKLSGIEWSVSCQILIIQYIESMIFCGVRFYHFFSSFLSLPCLFLSTGVCRLVNDKEKSNVIVRNLKDEVKDVTNDRKNTTKALGEERKRSRELVSNAPKKNEIPIIWMEFQWSTSPSTKHFLIEFCSLFLFIRIRKI